jgi:3',5'-cyclic AMP phosphodiesterase CpdA
MPGLFQQPLDRRSFLKLTSLTGMALTVQHTAVAAESATDRGVLRLALLSDTHVPGDRENGHRGFNPWTHLNAIAPEVAACRPEGVIINGDAARLEGKFEDYQELKALLAPVAAVAPVYIGLGNHDDRTQFAKVFPEPPGLRQPMTGRHVVVIEHEAVRIVILDSLMAVNVTPGLLGKAQRAWLARYLAEAADRPTVLFLHHTLEDNDGDLLDSDRLFALLQPHRHVKAIFYGHSHVWQLGEREGKQLVNLPAVGYNFRDQDPVGWVEARFRRTGVELTLHAFAGNRSDDGKTTPVSWR